MPNDSRPFEGSGSFSHSVDDLQHGPVLLIPTDDLHQLLARHHEEDTIANHIQQNRRGQQALNQNFLLPLFPQRRRVLPVLFGIDVFPSEEEFFSRRDRAELGFIAMCGDHQLVGME